MTNGEEGPDGPKRRPDCGRSMARRGLGRDAPGKDFGMKDRGFGGRGGGDRDFGDRGFDDRGDRRGFDKRSRGFGDSPGDGFGMPGDFGGGREMASGDRFGGGGGGRFGGGGGGGDRFGGGGGGGRFGGGGGGGGGRFGGGGGGGDGDGFRPRRRFDEAGGGGGGGGGFDRTPVERGPRQDGVVKFFNSEKGFGFITPAEGGPDVFVHISAVERSGLQALDKGQAISFETEPDKRGKGPKAVNLMVPGAAAGSDQPDGGPMGHDDDDM